MDCSSLAGALTTHFHSDNQLVLLDWQQESTCVRDNCTTVHFIAGLDVDRLPQVEATFQELCPYGGKLMDDRVVLRAAFTEGLGWCFQLGGEFVFAAEEVEFVYSVRQPAEDSVEAALAHPLVTKLERVHDVGVPAPSGLQAFHRARRIYVRWRNWPLALVTVDYFQTPFTRVRAWYRFPEGERVQLQFLRPEDLE